MEPTESRDAHADAGMLSGADGASSVGGAGVAGAGPAGCTALPLATSASPRPFSPPRLPYVFFFPPNRAFNRGAYPNLFSCFVRLIANASSGTSFVTVVPVAT
jgi:hypothetical protein